MSAASGREPRELAELLVAANGGGSFALHEFPAERRRSISAITTPTIRSSAASPAGGSACRSKTGWRARSLISASMAAIMSEPDLSRRPIRAPAIARIRRRSMPRSRACSTAGRYILGPEVEAFERDFAAYIGTRHGVGVASGTEALVLALRALDLGPEDYVVRCRIPRSRPSRRSSSPARGRCWSISSPRPTRSIPRSSRAALAKAPAAGPHRRGHAGASLWPGADMGAIVALARTARRARDRGLRAKPRRVLGGRRLGGVRRSRRFQLLSDEESRRASAMAARW